MWDTFETPTGGLWLLWSSFGNKTVKKTAHVRRWSRNVPVADVPPSWIQSLRGGQRAVDQSTQSSEDQIHLPTTFKQTKLGVNISPLYNEAFLSTKLVLLQVTGCTMRGSVSFCPPSTRPPPRSLRWVVLPGRSKPPGFPFPFPGEVRATSFYSARHRAF